jgi:RimJ/RimL family protein N-acetyltransferase
LFRDEQIQHIFADCFSSNHRCRRLVHRLGFVRQPIPVIERVKLICHTGCWRWHLRFRLDAKLTQNS